MPNDWMIDFFVLGEGDPAPCNYNDRCQMSESLQRPETDGSGNKRYKIQRYRHPRTLARTVDNPECTLPDKRISLNNHTTPGGTGGEEEPITARPFHHHTGGTRLFQFHLGYFDVTPNTGEADMKTVLT